MASAVSQETRDAVRTFNNLLNRLTRGPPFPSAKNELQAASKLSLIREAEVELGFGTRQQSKIYLSGINAFEICYRVLPKMLACLTTKLQDQATAAHFLGELREICSRVGFSGLSSESSPESSPKPSKAENVENSLFHIPNQNSGDDHSSSTSPARSSSDSDNVINHVKHKRRSSSAFPGKSTGKPQLLQFVTREQPEQKPQGMKRPNTNPATHSLGDHIQVKRARYQGPSRNIPKYQLTPISKTAWQDAENILKQSASYQQSENILALHFIKGVLTVDGIRAVKYMWESLNNVPASVQKGYIIWPADLANQDLPALRQFQEALVEYSLVKGTACSNYYLSVVRHRRFLARHELLKTAIARSNLHDDEKIANFKVPGNAPINDYRFAAAVFGSPVREGYTFVQRPYNYRLLDAEPQRSSTFLADGYKDDILHKAYGDGFFALISIASGQVLRELSPRALRQAVNAIHRTDGLTSRIQRACAEACRLIRVLKEQGNTKTQNLGQLKRLLAEVS